VKRSGRDEVWFVWDDVVNIRIGDVVYEWAWPCIDTEAEYMNYCVSTLMTFISVHVKKQ
jgi:hypothetical protein